MKLPRYGVAVGFVCGAWFGLCSCDSADPPSTGAALAPPHPAMSAPIGRPAGASQRSGLPAGHPPINPQQGEGAEAPQPLKGSVVDRLLAVGLACKLPQGWVEEAPSSAMRMGQVRLPRAPGDAQDGEMSISPAMGSLEDNVQRWRGQFVENPEPVLAERQVGGVTATLVELEGTFTAGGPQMKASGEPQAGTKLIGVIVTVPGSQQKIFFKSWGPKATMDRWRASFDDLVGSLAAAGK